MRVRHLGHEEGGRGCRAGAWPWWGRCSTVHSPPFCLGPSAPGRCGAAEGIPWGRRRLTGRGPRPGPRGRGLGSSVGGGRCRRKPAVEYVHSQPRALRLFSSIVSLVLATRKRQRVTSDLTGHSLWPPLHADVSRERPPSSSRQSCGTGDTSVPSLQTWRLSGSRRRVSGQRVSVGSGPPAADFVTSWHCPL